MDISLLELERRVAAYFRDLGAPEEEVSAAVEMCIDAELREHRSHGVRLLRNIATEYRLGADRRRGIRVERPLPAAASVDGGFHLSPFVHRLAVDEAITLAGTSGIGVVNVSHTGVSGALGYLVERIARAGLVGIALNSTPLVVVPPATSAALLGTNPLAIGVPRRGAEPVVLDMATSAIAFNEVMRRRSLGQPLPEGVALDGAGEPTTSSADAVDERGRGRVLPFGGHRGYGLALMIELIASGLVTGRTAADKLGDEIHEPDDFGAVYIAIDPRALGADAAGFAANDRLISDIVAAGGRIPGDHSARLRTAHTVAATVTLDDAACEVLGIQV